MRKVKKFKIPVYSHEVLRKARKQRLDLAGAGLAEEQALREYVSGLAAALEPAVVFDYFAKEDPAAARISPEAHAPLTAGVLTLGRAFEEKLAAQAEETHRAVDRIAAQVFLQTAVGVTANLALREAEPEGFEFGDPVYVFACPEPDLPPKEATDVPLYQNELIQELAARLEAEKIGASFADGAFSPRYSALFALPWQPHKKKK